MRFGLATSLLSVGLGLCVACTTTPPAQSPTSLTSSAGTEPGCALGVAGARASMADSVNGGVAITVLSTPRTDEIRVRVRDAAAKYGPDARQGLGHDGHHGEGGKHGLMLNQLPPLRASVEDVTGGARIDLAPVDVADREQLRKRTNERVAAMNANCE